MSDHYDDIEDIWNSVLRKLTIDLIDKNYDDHSIQYFFIMANIKISLARIREIRREYAKEKKGE